MILSPKRLPANVAGVRSLVRVCSLVDQQVVGFGKLSVAKFANKLLSWTVCAICHRRFDVVQSLRYWRRQYCGRRISRVVVHVVETLLAGAGGRQVAGPVLEMSGELRGQSVRDGGGAVHGTIPAGRLG